MKRAIQRERRKKIPEPPKSLSDLEIPDEWRTTSKGDNWLLVDITLEGTDRVIIFCTEQNLRHLGRSTIWYGDGTFSVAPQHFYQMYTIHGVVLKQTLPLVYCLLTKKSYNIYLEMFTALKTQAERRDINIAVKSFRIDFEVACIKGFKEIFPDAQVECCFFHLAQAHWRKIVDLGLRQIYMEDETMSLSLRMFTALAFVPHQHVKEAFDQIKETIPEIAEGFIAYMEDTYIGKDVYASKSKEAASMVST